MSAVLSVELLNKLDKLIQRKNLHSRIDEPVSVAPLLENFHLAFAPLPPMVEALTMRWYQKRHRHVSIAYNYRLAEPSRSARKRRADAHEFAHVACRHRGDIFAMTRWGYAAHPFDEWLDRCQEEQCEFVAAYLLVPLAALRTMRHEEATFIAQMLDVPVHLVELRWRIWKRFGR